jgi:hypothetical protein
MIGTMNRLNFITRSAAIATGTLWMLEATRTWAQVQGVNGDDPHITTESGNGKAISWAIVVIFGLGILGISFKSSKRTHRLGN